MKKFVDSKILKLNYLYVDKYLFSSSWIFPCSKLPYAMFRLITKGSGKFVINNEELEVTEDSLVYIPEGAMLACEANSEWFEFISIRFISSIKMDNFDELYKRLGSHKVISDVRSDIVNYFNSILEERCSESYGKGYSINGYLNLIFAYFINEISKVKDYTTEGFNCEDDIFSIDSIIERNKISAVKTDMRIQAVLEYIIINQEKHIELTTLYNMVDISPSSFRRLFKANTGKTPGEFINELKMNVALKKIISTEEAISSIAYETGFECPNYFTRQFKKRFGVSPNVYRKQSRL